VHFYSTFWRCKRSNRRSVTRWAGRCRAAASRITRAGASAVPTSESRPSRPARGLLVTRGRKPRGSRAPSRLGGRAATCSSLRRRTVVGTLGGPAVRPLRYGERRRFKRGPVGSSCACPSPLLPSPCSVPAQPRCGSAASQHRPRRPPPPAAGAPPTGGFSPPTERPNQTIATHRPFPARSRPVPPPAITGIEPSAPAGRPGDYIAKEKNFSGA
jgi:hypothetical protein